MGFGIGVDGVVEVVVYVGGGWWVGCVGCCFGVC